MNSFIDEITMASYDSEIDLDRDVPNPIEYDPANDIPENEDDFDFDAYCEANPDFNAAMNGHPEYI